MAARERRIRRMSTVPAIKFELSVLQEICAENNKQTAGITKEKDKTEESPDKTETYSDGDCTEPLMQVQEEK